MYDKINCFINGEYAFSTRAYRTCAELRNRLRADKHIEIASVPKNQYITVNDYDKIVLRKERKR